MSPQKFIKTFKNDLAPIGFFFDIFSTDLFTIPILPLPMRIDKLIKGESTYFIIPNKFEINDLLDELDLFIDLKSFFLAGINNLIKYAKKNYYEHTSLDLKKELILKWYENSLLLEAKIPHLITDFTFLISEYLKFYALCESQEISYSSEHYKIELLNFCNNIITYFKKIIEDNKFHTITNNLKKTVLLYKKKKENYYPEIVTTDAFYSKKNKKKRVTMHFVPYLIYDDILEVFSYNSKLLNDESQDAIDLKMWKNNGIINKRSNIDKFIIDKNVTYFKLEHSDLEKII